MSEVIIRAEGLGKKYLIGHHSERYTALRDVVAHTAKGMARSVRDMLHGRQIVAGSEIEEFWALKDVNFDIKRGEAVGIIGRNGAGKSTLLKILSRITEPSEGRVEFRGRVASLLEVGTGFHPELSGRENIFLNGAILGMTRSEIRRKFDEIVDFAEVERFLDTPVKRYSSGMYVRLAFAIAAHLEPEVLVIDEVLAVGDAEFQKKCLGKMQDVAAHGRTVLFVSHNMSNVKFLCSRCLLLRSGQLELDGQVDEIVQKYFIGHHALTELRIADRVDRKGDGSILVENVSWERTEPDGASATGGNFDLRVQVQLNRPASDIVLSIFDAEGYLLAECDTRTISPLDDRRSSSSKSISCTISQFYLVPGRYFMNVTVLQGVEMADHLENVVMLDVGETVVGGRFVPAGTKGVVAVPHVWSFD